VDRGDHGAVDALHSLPHLSEVNNETYNRAPIIATSCVIKTLRTVQYSCKASLSTFNEDIRPLSHKQQGVVMFCQTIRQMINNRFAVNAAYDKTRRKTCRFLIFQTVFRRLQNLTCPES